MSLYRTVVTAPIEVSHTFYVDEDPTDASTGVSVRVLRLDGSEVVAATPATQPAGTGEPYVFTVPASAVVDTLTVEWSADSIGGAVVVEHDFVEVAARYLFGLVECRALDPALDPVRFDTARLKRARMETEAELERITGRSFVPKFARVVLSGTGGRYLLLPHLNLRTVRSITIDGAALDSEALAAVGARDSGVLDRRYSWWPEGTNNIVVEYEHGIDYPPPDLQLAAMIRCRGRLTLTSSTIPNRAISWTAGEGGSYRLALPTRETTGMANVDDAYQGYTVDPGGFA